MDVVILAGLLGLAIVLGVGGQIYLRNVKRKQVQAESR